MFDVTMGLYDGAELCELVGLFVLNKLSNIFEKNLVGLYRDDGLAVLRNCTARTADRIKKSVENIFKSYGLKITAEAGLHQVEFLDITINFRKEKFWPYRKPNDSLLYINAESNHLGSIIKHLPKMIETRVSNISFNSEEFEKPYQLSKMHCERAAIPPTYPTNRLSNNAIQRRADREMLYGLIHLLVRTHAQTSAKNFCDWLTNISAIPVKSSEKFATETPSK